MKFYLSSFRLGKSANRLPQLAPKRRIGYINNALDFTGADPARWLAHTERELGGLTDLGFKAEHVDLKVYFGRANDLRKRLDELGAIFICGGNVFVLRQAMHLCGLDKYLQTMPLSQDFLYAGYSAGACVLSPTLRPYAHVDDATDTPYDGCNDVIWEGLGLTDFAFLPHWDSDHPESAAIAEEIEFCKREGIPYRAIRDGDVLIVE